MQDARGVRRAWLGVVRRWFDGNRLAGGDEGDEEDKEKGDEGDCHQRVEKGHPFDHDPRPCVGVSDY